MQRDYESSCYTITPNFTRTTLFVGWFFACTSLVVPLFKVPMLGSVNLFSMAINQASTLAIIVLTLLAGMMFFLTQKQLKNAAVLSFYICFVSLGVIGYFKYQMFKLQNVLQNLKQQTKPQTDDSLFGGITEGIWNMTSSILDNFPMEWGAMYVVAGSLGLGIFANRYAHKKESISKITYILLPLASILLTWFLYQNAIENSANFELPKASSLDSTNAVFSSLLTDTTKKAKKNPKKAAAYRKHIKLYDVSAKYQESLLNGRVPAVKFKLKNLGNKIVTDITITVQFLDKKGIAISEASFSPSIMTHLYVQDTYGNKSETPFTLLKMCRVNGKVAASRPTSPT